MTIHSIHPDIPTHGLCDTCERCSELANQITALDRTNTQRIWRGNVYSENDLIAYNNMYRAAVWAEHLLNAFGLQNTNLFSVGGKI